MAQFVSLRTFWVYVGFRGCGLTAWVYGLDKMQGAPVSVDEGTFRV